MNTTVTDHDRRTSPAYVAAHRPDGPCHDPRECLDAGLHTRPEPLLGNRTGPDGREFAWGVIDAIHEIGDYQIVEYRQDQSNHSASQPYCWERHGRTLFQARIKGGWSIASYYTLDSALVGAIAYKREGANSRAAMYFDRMTLPATEQD